MPTADFTFSGETKRIIVSSGVTSVDVQDMYSRWKDWIQTTDNSKYPQALRTFGGDPTIAGQFAPRYFFLTNGWRVQVDYDEVDFGVNLYTDELEPPVIVAPGAAASIRNSDAVNVANEVSQTLDYGGKVTINTLIGVTGTTYPNGTGALPVNNISDALTIANARGIDEFYVNGPLTIDIDVHDFRFNGGNIRDAITFNNIDVSGCTFYQCVLGGAFQGFISADNCILEDGISGMTGYYQKCGFRGSIYVNPGLDVDLIDCNSLVPGANESPSLFLCNDASVSLRKYSGGLKVYDSGTGSTASLEFTAGNCRLLTGNTGGSIVVRGIATLDDQTSGTTVTTEGLIIPYNIATQHSLNVNTEITRNK